MNQQTQELKKFVDNALRDAKAVLVDLTKSDIEAQKPSLAPKPGSVLPTSLDDLEYMLSQASKEASFSVSLQSCQAQYALMLNLSYLVSQIPEQDDSPVLQGEVVSENIAEVRWRDDDPCMEHHSIWNIVEHRWMTPSECPMEGWDVYDSFYKLTYAELSLAVDRINNHASDH